MSSDDSSIYEDLKKLLGDFDKAFKRNLAKYKFSKLYGLFVGLVIVISLGVAVDFSLVNISNGFSFAADLVIFGILAFIVFYAVFAFGLVHLYGTLYETADEAKRALSWQILVLFISLLLCSIFQLGELIIAGLVMFGILLFVYPVLKIIGPKATSPDFTSTLRNAYVILTILSTIIQFLLKYAKLF